MNYDQAMYASTQFKVGEAKSRYNQKTEKWHPAVGGAVKWAVSYRDQHLAIADAEEDQKNNNYSQYE